MNQMPAITDAVDAWHKAHWRPFYTCPEVREASGVGAPSYAPILRLHGWSARRVWFYLGEDSAPRLRVVWVPPGGFIARKRGRPPKRSITASRAPLHSGHLCPD
jgi:hypothetical protein